jgi:integrase/recombinase XerD
MKKETSKLIKEYITYKTLQGLKEKQLKRKESRLLALFSSKLIPKTINLITERDLNSYLKVRSKLICNKTYNDHVTLIKDFFNYLKQEDKILLNPARKLERIKHQTKKHLGVFTEEEVKEILKAIPATNTGIRDRAIIETLYSTGIRARELVMLNLSDIDFRNRELYIFNGKGDKERVVPIGSTALDKLENYYRVRNKFIKRSENKEAVFLSKFKERMKPDAISYIVKIYKHKANIKTKGSAHALRHSMATHMLKRGAGIKDIARILGHKKLDATTNYTHFENGVILCKEQ